MIYLCTKTKQWWAVSIIPLKLLNDSFIGGGGGVMFYHSVDGGLIPRCNFCPLGVALGVSKEAGTSNTSCGTMPSPHLGRMPLPCFEPLESTIVALTGARYITSGCCICPVALYLTLLLHANATAFPCLPPAFLLLREVPADSLTTGH